ncbi:MAG: hypothetical protein JWP36_2128 [Paucimonas sp.]|nr:hypothetical protein [Paucimonas sp.]
MQVNFRTLLYRYFFFAWLFRDVRSNDPYIRAACWAHNKQQARWLPTYLRRWSTISVGGYALGALAEGLLHAPVISTFFFVPAAVGSSIVLVIAVALIGLKTLSGPL